MSLVHVPVGIDVSKGWFDVCVLVAGEVRQARFSNDERGFSDLVPFLGREPVHVCLESTGGYERGLCSFLASAGILASRANPLLVRRFAEGMGMLHKTDRVDAFVLAEFCRARQPAAVELELPARRELRQLVRTLADLKKQRRQLRNRLSGPAMVAAAAQALETAMKGVGAAIAELEAQIERLLASEPALDEEVRLLTTVPGVGRVAALKLLAQLPEGALRSPRSLASYAGLAPGLRESGTSRKGSGIPIRCSRALRTIVFMAALVARRCCPHLKAFALRLVAAGKAKKQAIVAVARKLAHAIFAVLTKRQAYDGRKLCRLT